MPFIVQLEEGVWLDVGEGDPSRTLTKDSAHRFLTYDDAVAGLAAAREYRQFKHALIIWKGEKLVAMDITFEGDDAELLRAKLSEHLQGWSHGVKADMEITAWDPAEPPLVIKAGG
jgi:hypothetical protein